MPELGKKYLVTTDNYFFAPDGRQYRAVWGTVHNVRNDHDTLGIKTNARSTNWYLEIGNMIVAGCQIHYVVRSDTVNLDRVHVEELSDGKVVERQEISLIYNADGGVV